MDFIRKKSYENAQDIMSVKETVIGQHTFPYLQFPKLEQLDWISHLFTTRAGGVSEGKFESLNLSFSRGDIILHTTR